jgi:hypothetical protein
MPGASDVLDAITRQVFGGAAPATPRLRAVRRAVQGAVARRLLVAAAQPQQSPEARAALEGTLRRLAGSLASGGTSDADDKAFRVMLAEDLQRWLARPAAAGAVASGPPELPPGPPIGGAWAEDDCDWGSGGR